MADILACERRQRIRAELDAPDDGRQIRRADRLNVGFGIGRISAAFQRVDRDFEQRVDKADLLGPLPLARLFITLGEVGRRDAGER